MTKISAASIYFEDNQDIETKKKILFKQMFKDLKERNFLVRFHKKQIFCLRSALNQLDSEYFFNLNYVFFCSNKKINNCYNQYVNRFTFGLVFNYAMYELTLYITFDNNKNNTIKYAVDIYNKNTSALKQYNIYDNICSIHDINIKIRQQL